MNAWALPAYLYLLVVGAVLAVVDLRTHRLPDAIVLPSYPIAAALLTLGALLGHDWMALARGAVGAFLLWLVYDALARGGGVGWGDVKLAGLLGGYLAYLDWYAFFVGAAAGFVLGGVASAVVLVVNGRAGLHIRVPYGPYMLSGALFGVYLSIQSGII